MGVWGVIVGVFGSSFIEGSLVTAVCGSTIEPFSSTPLSKSLTESAVPVGAPGLGGLVLPTASSSKTQLVFSGSSSSGSVIELWLDCGSSSWC